MSRADRVGSGLRGRRPSRALLVAVVAALGSEPETAFGGALGHGPAPSAPAAAEHVAGSVVLLHGLGRSALNMKILEWRLQGRGYQVCNLGYDTRVPRIEDAVAQVLPAIRACAERPGPVHFVTHSLGGLVLRALLAEHALPEAGRAVMLAPPNRGSEISDRIRQLGFVGELLGPLSIQLGTRPEDLPGRLPPPPIPFGVIAGDAWINPAGPLWLPSPHDGTVSVERTRLDGMADHLVLPVTHTFIMNARSVADQVDTFLRQGRFRRVSGG